MAGECSGVDSEQDVWDDVVDGRRRKREERDIIEDGGVGPASEGLLSKSFSLLAYYALTFFSSFSRIPASLIPLPPSITPSRESLVFLLLVSVLDVLGSLRNTSSRDGDEQCDGEVKTVPST